MVRLRAVGGRLNPDLTARLEEADRAHAQGKVEAAAAIYHEVIAKHPFEPQALHMLGVIAQQQGNTELSLSWIDAALTVKPDFLEARYNRSVILRSLGRNEEAMQSVYKVLDRSPDFAPAWDMAGQILKDKGNYGHARKAFSIAIELQPENAQYHGNYALLLLAMDNWREAYKEARRASELDPHYPPMILGNILWGAGYPEKAAAFFAKARPLLPDPADSFASEAMAVLQTGDMEKGWALWENRPDLSPELKALPFWHGPRAQSLLLYEDQGIGDAIQFMRYIPLLKNCAEKITLRLRTPLVDLAAANFPDIEVISEKDPLPVAEARCRLSSLPFHFATRLNDIPLAPYLKPVEGTPPPLSGVKPPRIGLVWAGNAKFHNDGARSIPFATLKPLIDSGAGHFVSLQKEHSENLVRAGVLDAAPKLNTFAETAALMSELDLIISVDTAAAHLAGALGKPVFILLPFNADWRWLIGREDSPWYPSARLFRQTAPGDWATALSDVAENVRRFIAGDESVLSPQPWTGEPLRQNPNALEI